MSPFPASIPIARAETEASSVAPSDSMILALGVSGRPEVPRILTLDGALQFAARHDPSLRASAWRVRAARGTAEDAGKRPNPELLGEVENFGGDLGSGQAEITVGLGQAFELGGDRGARRDAAIGDADAAEYAFQAHRLELLGETAETFLAAWVAQEKLLRIQAAEGLARDAIAAATERFEKGASPEVDRIRAEGNLATLVAERRRAEAERTVGRLRLARRLGVAGAPIDSLRLDDPFIASPPPAESLLARLPEHPDRRRARAEAQSAEARVRLARALRVPDLGVAAGYRRLEEVDAGTFLVGIRLPLPLWNAGGGLLQSAESGVSSAESAEDAVHLEQEAAVRAAWIRLQAELDAYASIRDGFLPSTRQALDQLQRGYRAGRYTFLDLLEGQRSALDAEVSVLEATRNVWSATVALQQLTGGPIGTGAGGAR